MKIAQNDLYFTSDLHFHHKNVIKYSNRPFNDVDEMNSKIINNINEKVPVHGTLFILGDLIFGTLEQLISLMKRINCKNIYLILGNHDKKLKRQKEFRELFKGVFDYKEILVQDNSLENNYQRIILFHYPILEWDQGHRGSIMLHGHCHGNLIYPESLKDKKILDVGIDCTDYYPISYQEVKTKLKDRKNITHHD